MSAAPTTVKVYNLTDIPTPNLEQRMMVRQHIAIAGRMCEPGAFVEVVDSPLLRVDCKHLVSVGALSIGSLPPPYMQARNAKESSGGNAPSARVQHLEVKETKVADVGSPAAVEVEETASTTPVAADEPKVTSKQRR